MLLRICSVLAAVVAAGIGGFVMFGRNSDYARGMIPALVKVTKLKFETVPDLTGKTIIVTGANAGIGKSVSKILAANGATVIMGCRNPTKCTEAKTEIINELKSKPMGKLFKESNLVTMKMDLGSLKSIQEFVKTFEKSYKKLDSVILNAGVMHTPYSLTSDSIEMQMGVNYIGHYYLTKLLLPSLERAQPSTIVAVASNGHFRSYPEGIRLTLEEINDEAKYDTVLAYGQSKLATVLFAQELSEKLQKEGKQIYINSMNPGAVMDTSIGRHYGEFAQKFAKWFFGMFPNKISFDSDHAAMTHVYLAVSPEITQNKISGKYFVPLGEESTPSPLAKDMKLQKGLAEFTEKVLKQKGFA